MSFRVFPASFGVEFRVSVSGPALGQFRIRSWLVSDQAAASFGSVPGQFQVSKALQTTNYGHPVVPPKAYLNYSGPSYPRLANIPPPKKKYTSEDPKQIASNHAGSS